MTHLDLSDVVLRLLERCDIEDNNPPQRRFLYTAEIRHLLGVGDPPSYDGLTAVVNEQLCGDEHYRDGDNQPLHCNRTVDPQPDGRRHRGEHRYRDDTFGYSWPNRPKASERT